LKDLASRLPDTILHSRASSTVKKYIGAFRRWKRWVWRKLVMHFSWVHSYAGLIVPSSHPLVRGTLAGLQCKLAKPVVKKEPMTVEMLEALVADANGSGTL